MSLASDTLTMMVSIRRVKAEDGLWKYGSNSLSLSVEGETNHALSTEVRLFPTVTILFEQSNNRYD